MGRQITAIIVGAGHRAMLYASYSQEHPENLKIVGVADPDPVRRKQAADAFHFSEEMCFESAAELAEKPKLADAIINGTMDTQHVETTVPLLYKGYDVLLEKPFAVNEQEMKQLQQAVEETRRTVMICHVLRYAPFYTAIKEHIANGEIGDIINIQATEHVGYDHMAVSYIRGKWGNEEICGTSLLLAKCCHDIDMILWLKSGVSPHQISSFGSDFQFGPEKKPSGCGTRCMVDCPIENTCLYSAKKHYIDHPDRWTFYVWSCLEAKENVTLQDKEESLKTDNIHGRCVWDCHHKGIDHQSVMIEFADGATATLNMIGGAAKAERNLHVIGTTGEIKGTFDDSRFVIRKIDPSQPSGYSEKEYDLGIAGDKTGALGTHGGGDLGLVEDFVHVLQGKKASISCTTIQDSFLGHLCTFRADLARKNRSVETIPAEV